MCYVCEHYSQLLSVILSFFSWFQNQLCELGPMKNFDNIFRRSYFFNRTIFLIFKTDIRKMFCLAKNEIKWEILKVSLTLKMIKVLVLFRAISERECLHFCQKCYCPKKFSKITKNYIFKDKTLALSGSLIHLFFTVSHCYAMGIRYSGGGGGVN